ncbi:hypothetical protein KRX51_02720 [Corynebacterium sp. TAE3-ERU12]|nr:hypothetical protein [Corynebacterium sp. TAE3-ERU12]MBV7294835.1 hypothetical protein [Corynebacterium sp. TAE3-ERU12]
MAAPRSVIIAAWIAVVECVIGIGYGIFLGIRDVEGYEDELAVISGWGTGLWFIIIFGAVLVGAISLLRDRRWGRGPIVMLNICLLGVAYYMFTSQALVLAAITGLTALAVLACVFSPKAVDWAAENYGR